MNKRPVDKFGVELAAAVAVAASAFVPRTVLVAEVLESSADEGLPPGHGGIVACVDLVDLVVAVGEAFNTLYVNQLFSRF